MLKDPARLWHLMEEYDRLRQLEGHTPQSRGSRFNEVIAESLQCWGIDATANIRSAGEIDVVFTAGGVRFVLEAKWQKDKADTGQIAKLQKRVRQRLAGTYGVFLSMSGYSPEALAEVKDGERLEVLLLDGLHWEAMLGGLIPPDELLTLVRDRAAFHGEAYAPLPELFGPVRDAPPVSFDPPGTLPAGGLVTALPGVRAEVVLSTRSVQLGIACRAQQCLLVTTDHAILDVDPREQTVSVAVPLRDCSRNPIVLEDGTIFFARHNGVGCLRDGKITTAGGGFGGNICLLRSPDGGIWVFDNGAPPSSASITKLGEHLGQLTRQEIDYPAANAFTAAWLSAADLLVIGHAGFQVFSLATGDQRIHQAHQSNPMGVIHLREGVVLTSGDSVSLIRTDTKTWDHREVAQFALSPSVNELSQDTEGTVYLASHYPAPGPGHTFAIIRIRFPAGLI